MEDVARQAQPEWKPDSEMPKKHRNFQPPVYGMNNLGDIFTPRQLVALTTFSGLVHEVSDRVKRDAIAARLPDDGVPLAAGGTGATAYADAVGVYLGMATARYSNASSTICSWNPGQKKEDIRFTFSRQALPMTWDYAEGNPFSASSGNFADNFETWLYKVLLFLPSVPVKGTAIQEDAAAQTISIQKVVSTDPPYYDNISYADLSDYFYVWLRYSLKPVFPAIFTTLAVPKAEELIAAPHRHGGEEKAEAFFLDGMT
jgi:putative DNA methylase